MTKRRRNRTPRPGGRHAPQIATRPEDCERLIEATIQAAMHHIGERVVRRTDTELHLGVMLLRWGVYTILGMPKEQQRDAFPSKEAEAAAAHARMDVAGKIAPQLVLQVTDRHNGKADITQDQARWLRLAVEDITKLHGAHSHEECKVCAEMGSILDTVKRIGETAPAATYPGQAVVTIGMDPAVGESTTIVTSMMPPPGRPEACEHGLAFPCANCNEAVATMPGSELLS